MQKLTPASLPPCMYSTFVDFVWPTAVVDSGTKSRCADLFQQTSQRPCMGLQ